MGKCAELSAQQKYAKNLIYLQFPSIRFFKFKENQNHLSKSS